MNKKVFVAATILVPILISILAIVQIVDLAKAESQTIIVPDNYPTIQQAINNASEGDTIYVRKGVYVENPIVNKSVSLIGEDRDATIIDVTAGLAVESNSVTLSGFTIYDGRRGISLSGNHCSISGNKITDSTNGIVLFGCEKNSITGNTFKSIGLSSAIQLNFANRNLVNNNLIYSCVEGIQLREGSSNNILTGNTIVNCQDVAIRLLGSNLGSKWLGPDNNSIMQNEISSSGCGTTIYGANGNIISNNNYVYNTVQFLANEDYYLSFGYNRSINTINGNFWSDYKGKDANGDEVGDLPYIIDAFNKDNYPLMRPISTPSPTNPTPSPIVFPNTTPTPTPSPSPSPTLEPSLEPTQTATPTNDDKQTLDLTPVLVLSGIVMIAVVVGALVYSRRRNSRR